MVARKVAARLKPNSLAEFTNLMEDAILPWLRKQEGFLDLITLAVPGGREVATISFWEDIRRCTGLQHKRLSRSIEDSRKPSRRDSSH